MASKKFQKGSDEYVMMVDYWNLYQSLAIPEDNDDYWEMAVEKNMEFTAKYDKRKFVMDLSMALMDELERISKKED